MSVSQHPRFTRLARSWFTESPFATQAETYAEYLKQRGYALRTIESYLSCISHFAHWCLAMREATPNDFSEALFTEFLNKHLPACRCAQRCRRARNENRAALGALLQMLGVRSERTSCTATLPIAISEEVDRFNQYLTEVCGLSPATRLPRMRQVGDFLIDRFGSGPVRFASIKPADVANFMSRYTAGWKPGSIKGAGIAFRSYFAFRAVQGDPTTALSAALPRVAQWRLSGLPQVLSQEEIDRLLHAFDRRKATGKRDYAITRCLLDLGLRRAEVAQLRLEDVDWRAGTVRLRAKGKRIDVLPLPENTGKAIAVYLQEGRPQTTRREIFVRHRPPLNAPAGLDIIRNALRYAAKRADLADRIRGTHILRHTLAGRMVQGGARFKEIADLLRHRSLDSTTIYAKVDLVALAEVALPWPGRQS